MEKFASREQEREVLAWIIRKFPEGRMPVNTAQYLIEHPEELPDMLLGMVANRTVTTPAQLQAAVSDWQKFFGHLQILDSDFNETNFPLGVDPGDEAEEFDFGKDVTGHVALPQHEWASPWAIGRYIKAHPDAQKAHPLVGIGAQWVDRNGNIWFPFFFWGGDEPFVVLDGLGYEFCGDCRFLRKKKR